MVVLRLCGEAQLVLSIQILLGLSEQHSFFLGMGQEPFGVRRVL
jgi:hypothetical protein